ncbi:protein NLRC3-like [Montipora capricornis]|uniref:protein NLRC3-like n=1 Tax=Montipora capricornis TaxID=246305 RepID=UPI0035F136F5
MASTSWLSQEHEQASGYGKIKITILASEWGSSEGGIRELAIQLAKFSHAQITVFLLKCREEEIKEALRSNVKILEATQRPGYEELEWLSFPPEDLQIDIIVGHGAKLGHQAQIIRKSHTCKWVQVVDTDPEELGMFESDENAISKGEEKRKVEVELCEMADFVVGVGPKLTEAFRRYLHLSPKPDIFELTPSIFDEFVNVQQAPDEPKHHSVLVFGRGNTEHFKLKGFDIVAKSIAALPDTRLVFVGAPNGKHEEIAKQFLEFSIPKNRLRVRGDIKSQEDLKQLFCEVDLALMPSRTEGFGLPGLKALSAGLPVLVSKNSGLGEALSNVPFSSLFVVNSEDADVWATAIRAIWNKERRVRLDEAIVLRDSYRKKYSWTEQIKDLLEKMHALVSGVSLEHQQIPAQVQRRIKRKCSWDLSDDTLENEHPTRPKLGVFSAARQASEQTEGEEATVSNAGSSFKHHGLSQTEGKLEDKKSVHHEGASSSDQSTTRDTRESCPSSQCSEGTQGASCPSGFIIERIRQIYQKCEGVVLPIPWCEDFSFHLKDIFTRLEIVTKEKRRGTVKQEITNMTGIFTPHKDCHNPLIVLIEGEPGMGKTTYSQKLAYDWATKQDRDWDESFPKIEVLLLLRCRDINSSIWEAIDDQILPEDVDTEVKEVFVKFLKENPSKVLLVLDGLDETDPQKVEVYLNLIKRKQLSGCHIVLTSRHEAGKKVTPYSDTLLEIKGFTESDAKTFIRKYFEHREDLAKSLITAIWHEDAEKEETSDGILNVDDNQEEEEENDDDWDVNEALYFERMTDKLITKGLNACAEEEENENDDDDDSYEDDDNDDDDDDDDNDDDDDAEEDCDHPQDSLRELTRSPLHTIFLCVIFEDLGSLPQTKTKLFMEMVRCVLRRYEVKNNISSESEDLVAVYKNELLILGRMALKALRKGESYFEDTREGNRLIKFGFLSDHGGSSRRKPCVRYTFLHPSFQEFFAGLHLAFQLLDGEVNCQSLFTEERQWLELYQVFLFMSGITALKNKDTVVSLINSMATHVNSLGGTSPDEAGAFLIFVCDCIAASECQTVEDNLHLQLAHHLGETLHLTELNLSFMTCGDACTITLCLALEENSTLKELNLSWNDISDKAINFLAKALSRNSTLTDLNLCGNYIGDAGLVLLSNALQENSTLTELNLCYNIIGVDGITKLSEALKVNSALTILSLDLNLSIGVEGASSFSDTFTANSTLTHLYFGGNGIGDGGTAFVSQALNVNSTVLSHLDLSLNGIGDEGAASISKLLKADSTLSSLNLSVNLIGYKGASSLFTALAANSTLTDLDLSFNSIGDEGVSRLPHALEANTTLSKLDLCWNKICDKGASYVSNALATNSTLSSLNLSWNNIGHEGAAFLSRAVTANSTLIDLDLSVNSIGDRGASSLSQALLTNSTLTNLDLSWNSIGNEGAASLAQSLGTNSTLTDLDLSWNSIGDDGVTILSTTLTKNSTLTNLDLSSNSFSDDSASSSLEALKANSTLTDLDLSGNGIGGEAASYFFQVIKEHSAVTYLRYLYGMNM